VRASITAPESLQSRLKSFIENEHIELKFAIAEPADLTVCMATERLESTCRVFICGGWIDCEVARGAAERLGLPKRDLGRLLDFLDVKVRNCALGCFK
jgi:hypothetical protein